MALSSKCRLAADHWHSRFNVGWKCVCAKFKGLVSGSFYSNVNLAINSTITHVLFWHIWSSNMTLQGSFPVLITQLPAWMCLCSCEAAWGPGLRLKVVQNFKKGFFLWISSWFWWSKQLPSHSRGDSLGLWNLGQQHCWKQMLVKLFLGRLMWQQLFFFIIWGENI